MTLLDGQLHLIRPEWLWLLVPAALVVILLSLRTLARHDWQRDVDPELLPWLLVGNTGTLRRWPLLVSGMLAALLITIAAAGPSWQRIDVPVLKPTDALVIVLDASPSMLAEDVAPSRMQRARFKLDDLLQRRQEGQTGLVLYGGDAFVVAPLTDDNNTLLNLLPQLGPDLMPVAGSNPRAAFELALELLDSAGNSGRILWVTDGVTEAQVSGLIELIGRKGHTVTALGVGTERGAPIPSSEGGFIKGDSGEIVVAALNDAPLRRIARSSGGNYQRLTLNDNDLAALLTPSSARESINVEREFDQWQDAGWIFALALLPLCLAGFRRGWLLSLPLLCLLTPEPAMALDWQSLWSRPDQQGQAAMNEGAYGRAAEHFEHREWKAAAQYRDGEFESAAATLDGVDSARARYNRGNALAQQRDFPAAIEAYTAALDIDPDHEDARFNKALLEQLMQQQEQQPSDQQDQQPQPDKDGEQQDNSQQSQSENDQQSEQQQQQQGEDGQASNAEQQNQPQQSESQNAEQDDAQSESEQQQAQTDQQQQQAEQQYEQAAADARQQDDASGEEQQMAAAIEDEALTEEQQALEQWLRQIPDNPGGLLRRKFRHQHIQRREQTGEFDRSDVAPY